MKQLNWTEVPKDLIDDAEELLRIVLLEPEYNFIILQESNLGMASSCLSKTTEVDLDWNDLSTMGLLVYINAQVFHPAGYAVARTPETGASDVVLLENEPWTYSPEVYQEAMNKMLALNMLVEGWNIPWSDH